MSRYGNYKGKSMSIWTILTDISKLTCLIISINYLHNDEVLKAIYCVCLVIYLEIQRK